MKARRVFRPNRKTPEERAKEQRRREEIQRAKPSLDDLVTSGECDADAVMTMGMPFDVHSRRRSAFPGVWKA